MTPAPERPEPRRRGTPGSKGTTRDVRRPWKIGKARSRTRPYMVRWVVAGDVVTQTFATFALADGFRSDLIQAMGKGEEFDIATGLPKSMLQVDLGRTWFDFCQAYVAMRWDSAAAKTRDSITDSLATATLAMVEAGRDLPAGKELRAAFIWAILPVNAAAESPEHLDVPLRWLRQRSLLLGAIAEPAAARRVLQQLTVTLDGRPAAAETYRRRRRGVNTAIEYAIELGELTENPLKRVKMKPAAVQDYVDPRVVVTPAQARELLIAVSYVGSWSRGRGRRLVAFFAVLYYTGIRPAEAVALRLSDCYLPERGWGRIVLARTLPVTVKKWTNDGERHDHRGLKQRDAKAVRIVPIPPRLVRIILAHIREFGTAADGRIFRNERGGVLGSTTFWRVWEEARHLAFTPAQVESPLAGRPYDLRHAALSTWLTAGVSPQEVARRAGNSVEVLLRTYAACLDNQEDAVNRRIGQALEDGADQDPDDD
jgi:integrase